MNNFKPGDDIFWFESDCAGHWTVRFFAEGLHICQGIFYGIDEKGYAKITGQKVEVSKPDSYYKSKEEAINSMIIRLKKIQMGRDN